MKMVMQLHDPNEPDNAHWDEEKHIMVFGDGNKQLYPLTTLGIIAHEISHGFTEQHSNLIYVGQSGALNESFSDMAAQAAEYFVDGKSSWLVGEKVNKDGGVMRSMSNPPIDGISIDTAKNYKQLVYYIGTLTDNPWYQNGAIVHSASGVFNKLFFLLGTAQNWNTHKAFNVMVKANQDYWQPNATFESAACGVIHATEDYAKKDANYDLKTVQDAFTQVGIDVSQCLAAHAATAPSLS